MRVHVHWLPIVFHAQFKVLVLTPALNDLRARAPEGLPLLLLPCLCNLFCWGGLSSRPTGQRDSAGEYPEKGLFSCSSPALELPVPAGLLSSVIALLLEDGENRAVLVCLFNEAFITITITGSFYGRKVFTLNVAGILCILRAGCLFCTVFFMIVAVSRVEVALSVVKMQ